MKRTLLVISAWVRSGYASICRVQDLRVQILNVEPYPLGDLCLRSLFSRVSKHFRVQTLTIEAYPLGDLCLSEIWICLLGFLPRIHTEEVEGSLVGLGCIGVLGFISMHLHRQTHCQQTPAQTARYAVSIHLHRQTDTLSAYICTDRHTVA